MDVLQQKNGPGARGFLKLSPLSSCKLARARVKIRTCGPRDCDEALGESLRIFFLTGAKPCDCMWPCPCACHMHACAMCIMVHVTCMHMHTHAHACTRMDMDICASLPRAISIRKNAHAQDEVINLSPPTVSRRPGIWLRTAVALSLAVHGRLLARRRGRLAHRPATAATGATRRRAAAPRGPRLRPRLPAAAQPLVVTTSLRVRRHGVYDAPAYTMHRERVHACRCASHCVRPHA